MKQKDEANKFKRTKPPKQDVDKTPPDGSFLMVDKNMLKNYGTDIAIFMANLIDKYFYFKKHFPEYNGAFFLTYQQQTDHTKMSAKVLRKCKGFAIMKGWIETRLKGRPPKEWYTINVQHPDLELDITKSNSLNITKSNTLNITKSNKYKDTKYIKENKINTTSYEDEEINKNLSSLNGKNKNTSIKKNNSNSSDQKITFNQFDIFWKFYPKKVGKGKAKKEWEKLCRKKDRPSWKIIRRAIHEQKKSEQWQNEQFIKHPTTWLNQYGWLDDAKEMKAFTPANAGAPANAYHNPNPDKFKNWLKNTPANAFRDLDRDYGL